VEHHSNYTAVKDVMCPCMDEISIIWMNCFFLEENKSEAITAIILQPRMLCVHVWMKFQHLDEIYF